MVSRNRLKSFLTGVALYAMAAALIGYFGVNAYTGKYGLNAQQELDQRKIHLGVDVDRTLLWHLEQSRVRIENGWIFQKCSDTPGVDRCVHIETARRILPSHDRWIGSLG